MSSREACILEVGKKASKLSPEDIQKLASEIKEIIGRSESTGKDTAKIVKEFSDVYRRRIEMSKVHKLKSIEKYEQGLAFIEQAAFSKDPISSLRALIENDPAKTYIGDGNIYRKKNAIRNNAQKMLIQVMDDHPALKKRFDTGDIQLERDLYKILSGGSTKNMAEDVLALADTLKNMNNYVFNLKRQVGYGTRYLENFVAPGRHSVKAMRAMGSTLEEAKAKWTALASRTFDFQRMEIHPDKIADYLDTFFDKRMESEGNYYVKINDSFSELVTNSVSERMGKSRSVHFKVGEGAYDYNLAMGGKTLSERILAGIEKDSGNIAAAQMLGPNHLAVWNKLIGDVKKKANEVGKPIGPKDIENLNDFFKYAVQGDHQPEMNLVAKTGKVLRQVADMSKLGTALFTTATDFAYAAGIISGTTGKNFLGTQASVIKQFFKTVPLKEQRKLASMLSVFTQDLNGNSMASHRLGDLENASDYVPNTWFDSLHNKWMQMTGLPRQARSMRIAVAKLMATSLEEVSHLKFSDIDTGLQRGLGKFGIDETKWDILRGAGDDFGDGTRGLTVEKIHHMDDSVFAKMKEVTELEPAKKNSKGIVTEPAQKAFDEVRRLRIGKLRNELAANYSGFLEELSELGSPTPGVGNQFFKATWSGNRNTYTGQVIRFAFQYKSFILAQVKTMKGIAHAGDNKIKTTASTIVAASAWGYVALAMKDLAAGREPRDPTDPATWIDSFAQSGAGLIYTDYLLAEYQKSWISLASQIVGPVPSGLGGDIGELIAKGLREPWRRYKINFGDNAEAAAAAKEGGFTIGAILSKMERNTPNLFMSKALLNKNIYEAIFKSMNIKRRKSKKYKNFYEFDLHGKIRQQVD